MIKRFRNLFLLIALVFSISGCPPLIDEISTDDKEVEPSITATTGYYQVYFMNTDTGLYESSESIVYVTFEESTMDLDGNPFILSNGDFEGWTYGDQNEGSYIYGTVNNYIDFTVENWENGVKIAEFIIQLRLTTPPSDDSYEPDNNYSQASPITIGEVQAHTFSPAGDHDWVKFVVTSTSEPYTIQTLNLSNGADTILNLYDIDGTSRLANNDDYIDLDSRIVYTFATAGTYYVMVEHYSMDIGIGKYDITVSKTTTGGETVASPVFSPTGGPYTTPVDVTISCSTSSVTIRYTTDESIPSETHGTIIASGSSVNISSSQTLKSIAYKTDLTTSRVTSYYYEINTPGTVATPIFSPTSSIFANSQNVTIYCPTSEAAIRYTINGSNPTSSYGTLYSRTINVTSNSTIRAIAYKTGSTNSGISYATFTKLNAPTGVSASDGDYTDRVRVNWNSVSGANRYYVYRASSPTGTYISIGSTSGNYLDDNNTTVLVSYSYKVRAYTDGVYSNYSIHNTGYENPVTVPIPTGVSASDGSYTDRVRISYNSVSGSDRYYVYRATSSGGSYSSFGYTTSTYKDDTLANPGTTYYYKIKAYTNGVYSGYSSNNSGWRGLVPPTNVSATDGTYTDKIRISWNSVTGATRYYVYRSTSPNGTFSSIGDTVGLYGDDTTATQGTTYFYKIRSYNEGHYSDYSSYTNGRKKGIKIKVLYPSYTGYTTSRNNYLLRGMEVGHVDNIYPLADPTLRSYAWFDIPDYIANGELISVKLEVDVDDLSEWNSLLQSISLRSTNTGWSSFDYSSERYNLLGSFIHEEYEQRKAILKFGLDSNLLKHYQVGFSFIAAPEIPSGSIGSQTNRIHLSYPILIVEYLE